ncbi:MAG: bifunctional adenosylcobinamide kinase/adenosylcobinamide-phosphate guanylyltransferase [Desulfohalobiaceae bacterium]
MQAKQTILVLGGCKSGKSAHALELAREYPRGKRVFVATCQARDPEMQNRVDRHRQERGPGWQTLEEPVDLPGCILSQQDPETVLLADCLTLWLSNLLQQELREEQILERFDQLQASLEQARGRVILVANEVGAGLVPMQEISRLFRDLAGVLNQRAAASAQQVFWLVAGIPVRIK